MSGFLDTYCEFSDVTEIPKSYTMFTGLGVLSSLIAGRCWMDMGTYVTNPQLYVVLVGPPGNLKSSALSVGEELMREIQGVPLSSDCPSYRALIEEIMANQRGVEIGGGVIQQVAPLTCCLTELSNFLLNGGPQTIDICTTIYGKKTYRYKTHSKGSVEINGPYLVIMACATPAWITARLRDDIISGGFSRRALWVAEDDTDKDTPFGVITEKMKQQWATLVAMGREIQKMKGPFIWTQEARDYYIEWYPDRAKRGTEASNDYALSGYYKTKHVQLQKVAMLVSLSSFGALKIQRAHLEEALRYLDIMEKRLGEVFEGIGRNENNAGASYLLRLIARNGGEIKEAAARTTLYRIANSREFDDIVQHLVRSKKMKQSNGTLLLQTEQEQEEQDVLSK